jgi:hypothetical protein
VGIIKAADLLHYYGNQKEKEGKYHSPMLTRKYGVKIRRAMGHHAGGVLPFAQDKP